MRTFETSCMARSDVTDEVEESEFLLKLKANDSKFREVDFKLSRKQESKIPDQVLAEQKFIQLTAITSTTYIRAQHTSIAPAGP